MGSHLKSWPKNQKSSLNTGRFILDFVVPSSVKYKKITKEKKDPKDPYAINTCSTQLLSSKLNIHMYWNCTDHYRKAFITKLYVLKISNKLINCQTKSKMQLKKNKLTHKANDLY